MIAPVAAVHQGHRRSLTEPLVPFSRWVNGSRLTRAEMGGNSWGVLERLMRWKLHG
jgi:hypothetical protein